MSESTQWSKELWSSPKVLLMGELLIVEDRRYELAETVGAYVENAPDGDSYITPAAHASVISKIFKTIWLSIRLIFSIFLSGQRNGNDGVGITVQRVNNNAPQTYITTGNHQYREMGSLDNLDNLPVYRLILNGKTKSVSVLQHTNQSKLEAIASQVNEALVRRGVVPITSAR